MNKENKFSKEVPQEVVESFDVTGSVRQEALKKVESIILRASKGEEISGQDYFDAITGIYTATIYLDMIVRNFMYDFFTLAENISRQDANSTAISAQMMTIVKILEDKKILTIEEVAKEFETEVYPAVLEELKKEMETKKAGKEEKKNE